MSLMVQLKIIHTNIFYYQQEHPESAVDLKNLDISTWWFKTKISTNMKKIKMIIKFI